MLKFGVPEPEFGVLALGLESKCRNLGSLMLITSSQSCFFGVHLGLSVPRFRSVPISGSNSQVLVLGFYLGSQGRFWGSEFRGPAAVFGISIPRSQFHFWDPIPRILALFFGVPLSVLGGSQPQGRSVDFRVPIFRSWRRLGVGGGEKGGGGRRSGGEGGGWRRGVLVPV